MSRADEASESAQVRDKVSVQHQVRGRTMTIVERRPPWSPTVGPEWTTMPIAQLRYARPHLSGVAGNCTGPTAIAAGT